MSSFFNFLTVCSGEEDSSTALNAESRERQNQVIVDTHNEELQEEQKRSEELTRKIQSLEDQLALYDPNEVKQLQQELQAKDAKLEQSQIELEALQKSLSEVQMHRDQLAAKIQDSDGSKYLDTLEEYQTQFREKDTRITELESKLREYETLQNNDTTKDEIAALQKQQNELQQKLEHERKRADGTQQLLDAEAKENQQLKDKLQNIEKDKAKVTKVGFADAIFGSDDDDFGTDEDYDDEKEFVELVYRTTGPTVIGLDWDEFNAAKYAVTVNNAIDKMQNNPKERIREAVKILIECNAAQRSKIASIKADVTLVSKYRLYSNNKKVLQLLDSMMKSAAECDAEWLKTAIKSKNEAVVIEILFTRTNAQIGALTEAYARLFESQLFEDIEGAFQKKDETFVKMCGVLIALDARVEQSRGQVNKNKVKNDAAMLKEALMDNNDEEKAWKALFDFCVTRSWNHLDRVERTFNHDTKIRLIYQLKKCNPNRSIARKAVMVVLEAAHSMHELFASYLQQALKKKKDDALQRVLLSRSEIDLADIDQEFTNNEQFGEGKTTRVWIENSTQSSLYRYILLSLLGLHEHDTERMESIRDRVMIRAPTKINLTTPKVYKNALVKYNPSIVASTTFDVDKDADDISIWIKSGDSNVLKEKLGGLLPNRSAAQRGAILAQYPKVIEDITKVIKKGNVLTICDGLLKASIAAYEAALIEKALDENDVNIIGDILCTRSNKEIVAIIDAYKETHYKAADLAQKVADLCERSKRGTARLILDALLKCNRSEKKKAKVDMRAVAIDVEFLVSTKKFKAAEKEKFVQIFCNNDWKYIRAVNRQFGMKSSMTLEKLIRDKLGAAPANFTLILLKYSCDPTEYFAQRLYELGVKFDKNKEEIARIFLTRSEVDLNGIRARFAKTPYGKTLDAWLKDKAKESRFGLFLSNMLSSIDEHNDAFDENEEWSDDDNKEEQDVVADAVTPTPSEGN